MKQITPEEIAQAAIKHSWITNGRTSVGSYEDAATRVDFEAGAEWYRSQKQPEWVQTTDQLPEVGIPVIVETYFFDNGTPSTDVFTGYMDEAGELYMYPSMDHYGWTFEECVVQWTEIPQPPTK